MEVYGIGIVHLISAEFKQRRYVGMKVVYSVLYSNKEAR